MGQTGQPNGAAPTVWNMINESQVASYRRPRPGPASSWRSRSVRPAHTSRTQHPCAVVACLPRFRPNTHTCMYGVLVGIYGVLLLQLCTDIREGIRWKDGHGPGALAGFGCWHHCVLEILCRSAPPPWCNLVMSPIDQVSLQVTDHRWSRARGESPKFVVPSWVQTAVGYGVNKCSIEWAARWAVGREEPKKKKKKKKNCKVRASNRRPR
jgi:hypothetical protein